MNTAYIALGSNVGDRLDYLRKGKEMVERKVQIIATSPIYDTEPIGSEDQARFLNAVVAIRTELSPEDLLALCLDIEKVNGRTRDARNAPRTLDLDLIFYNSFVHNSTDLTLPHPRMHERAFVLSPLADINPELVHPVLQASVKELLAQCEMKERFIRQTDHTL